MILPPPDSLERLTHADLIGVVRDLIGEVTRMRVETEKLDGALTKLRVAHQAVKDELARLKHLPPRPGGSSRERSWRFAVASGTNHIAQHRDLPYE